jgi:hypothetical protein
MTYIDPDSREGLLIRIEEAKAVLSDPRADWFLKEKWRTSKRCAEDRLHAMLLTPNGSTGMRPPNLNDYGRLLERSVKLFDNDQAEGKAFLDNQLTRNLVNPETLEGFNWRNYNAVIDTIADFEKLAKPPRKKREKAKEPVLVSPPKAPKEPKAMGLFKSITTTEQGAVNTATGEVIAKTEETDREANKDEREQIMAEARARLGIYHKDIETRDQFERVMRRRAMAIVEYGYVKQAAEEAMARCLKEIEDIDTAYKSQLEMYHMKNVPEGKKTLTGLWGDLGTKAQPESLSLAEGEEKKFEAWLAVQSDAVKKACGIQPRTVYDRNIDAIKAWWFEQRKANPKVDPPAGMQLKPAREVFSIRPSIDTFKKEPSKYVQRFGTALASGE